MRRRVLAILLVFSVVAIVAFAVPLAFATAAARTRELGLARASDATYFAAAARRTGDPIVEDQLQAELDRYHGLYGEGVLVVDARGTPRASAGLGLGDLGVPAAITAALRNQKQNISSSLTPWANPRALLAVPVGTGAQVDGAVVLEASTAAARHDIRTAWITILAGAAAALTVVTGLAVALSRWTVRPLELLTDRVADLTAQVPRAPGAPVSEDPSRRYHGPPEVRQLARSFDTMSATVRSSVRAQRQLVADTAHKLRNPLAALQIRLDSLATHLPEAGAQTHRRASAEASRLGEILDALLALAAAEVPDDERPEVCNLPSVVADRADAWSAALAEKEMRLTVGDDMHVQAAVSGDRLAQVLDVLLSNSCRYAGTGVTVTIDARRESDGIRLSYRDDGIGVPPEELERLTERFYRASSTSESGTGLGLSIAGALVEAIGGRLELHEVRPHGLRIDLVLPAVSAEEAS
ncbi:sensor histidine kinase [Rhodococcus sp. NPDC058521]|uniref:sensor histidine kinase n=1 Tax=Rhodococcus sp. NPDC058521 TaxID=3346536 RepID=UPI00364C4C0B